MQKEDISFLKQLVKSLEEAEERLKLEYDRKDSEGFNSTKSFMLKMQKQIEGILESFPEKGGKK